MVLGPPKGTLLCITKSLGIFCEEVGAGILGGDNVKNLPKLKKSAE